MELVVGASAATMKSLLGKLGGLKVRAQQIGERRHRYGVSNPHTDRPPSGTAPSTAAGFDAADNKDTSLQLVADAVKGPVGVQKHMKVLDKRVTCILGFGGVGKTAIATALYKKFGDQFGHRAVVTVSQSSDLEMILRSIKSQVSPHTENQDQQGGSLSVESRIAAAVRGVWHRVSQGASAVMAKCCSAGTSREIHDRMKLDQLKKEIQEHFKDNR